MIMDCIYVIVYSKDNTIKVLSVEKAKLMNESLINDGWEHTNTLDVCMYLQYLHNHCEDIEIIENIKSLSLNNNEKNIKE